MSITNSFNLNYENEGKSVKTTAQRDIASEKHSVIKTEPVANTEDFTKYCREHKLTLSNEDVIKELGMDPSVEQLRTLSYG